MLKITLIIVQKIDKIGDNKTQFELKIAVFHVLYGKIIKNTLFIGPNNRKNTG